MTEEKFREIALSMPEATEGSHMGHPDFRVGGKVFASITWDREDAAVGMVKLTPKQQATFVADGAGAFTPVNGAWGAKGATHVHLGAAKVGVVRKAMRAAWLNTAPASMRGLLK